MTGTTPAATPIWVDAFLVALSTGAGSYAPFSLEEALRCGLLVGRLASACGLGMFMTLAP